MSSKKKAPASKTSKDDTKRSLKANSSAVSVPLHKVESRETIMKNLLIDLLSNVTSKCETRNCFAKFDFGNSNSYYGWIDCNGFQGFGTYTFADGTCYRGSFNKSLTQGLGRYQYLNGNTYEGEFLCGYRNGYGLYKTRRFRYDGHFQNGKFHGTGVWKSKTEEERGSFEEGTLREGEARDSCGVFTGTFDKSGLRKHGKFVFKNGNIYYGSWSNDLFYGFGIYDWVGDSPMQTKAQTKYIGYWLEGKRHALGMQIFEQRTILCQWSRNRKFGAGIVVACNGHYYASPDMFNNNQYVGAHRIELCEESRAILLDIMKLTIPSHLYNTMEERSSVLLTKIKELVQNHSDWFSEIYPIRIPHHELCMISLKEYNKIHELKSLQQLLSEQYKEFSALYNKYIYPGDEYMNNFSLNLFYMDAFSGVHDVNIANVLRTGLNQISHQHIYAQDNLSDDAFTPVPFYEFFQHFIHVTHTLMMSEEFKFETERLRPTFFGRLAMQVLICFKMLREQEQASFLVREALLINRPEVLDLLRSIKKQSLGDSSIRAAYMFLKNNGIEEGSCLSFIEASQMYFSNMYQDGFLSDSEFNVSDLELVEVVLRTSQIQIAKEELKREIHLRKLRLQMGEKQQLI